MFLNCTGDTEAAGVAAIWPEATLEQLQDVEALQERLPRLMKRFRMTWRLSVLPTESGWLEPLGRRLWYVL